MTRQQRVLFRDEPPLAHFPVSLVSLRDMPRKIVPGQLRQLLEVAALPNVTLQVVPVLWHAGMSGELIVADTAAYTESLIGGQIYADDQTLSELSRRFASIAAEAMRASESEELIREMLNRELAKVKLLKRQRGVMRRDRQR